MADGERQNRKQKEREHGYGLTEGRMGCQEREREGTAIIKQEKTRTCFLKEDPVPRELLKSTHFSHRLGLHFTNRVASSSGENFKHYLGGARPLAVAKERSG